LVSAVDSSAIVSWIVREPGSEVFGQVLSSEDLLLGWPTAFEIRRVLAGKRLAHARSLADHVLDLPNVTLVSFDERHYRAAEYGFEHFGKGKGNPPVLNLGDCFSYAVAKVADSPLLFRGRDFGRTDLKRHPASIAD
jgi:ribonuclease VapC